MVATLHFSSQPIRLSPGYIGYGRVSQGDCGQSLYVIGQMYAAKLDGIRPALRLASGPGGVAP